MCSSSNALGHKKKALAARLTKSMGVISASTISRIEKLIRESSCATASPTGVKPGGAPHYACGRFKHVAEVQEKCTPFDAFFHLLSSSFGFDSTKTNRDLYSMLRSSCAL